jgi:hypothetical protein
VTDRRIRKETLWNAEEIMIKKIRGGYQVVSSKGKNLGGPYKTLEAAKKRLRQVEFFKHRNA